MPPWSPGGVGSTFGSAENFGALYRDVTTKLFDRLPATATTQHSGAERPHLDEWRARGW